MGMEIRGQGDDHRRRIEREAAVKISNRIPGFSGLTVLLLAAGLLVGCRLPTAITSEHRALLIGINDYPNLPADKQLATPENDAFELKKKLQETGWLEPLILNNGTISKVDIENKIQDLGNQLTDGDTALLYFSGHGTAIGDEAYIVPSDYSSASSSPLISMTEFGAWIKSYILPYTSNVIVIIDACNSGGFVSQSDSADIIDPDYDVNLSSSVSSPALAGLGDMGELLAKNLKQTGKLEPIVMSAAGFDELSWESTSLKHGVFTYYLMKAAESGDSNRDEFVSATEAYTYAAKGIDKNWNGLYGNGAAFYPHITGGLRDMVLFDLH
jgi:hypothetical protein